MGRILTLTVAQAQEIRSGILYSYRQGFGIEFQPVTYLGAYEELRTHILSKCTEVSGAEASISLHRLRKLFYYTDPAYCPKDKLESLSFGDDFISLLSRFKSAANRAETPLSKESNLPVSKTRVYLLSFALIVLALSGFLTYKYFFRAPYFFRDDFHSNSVAELKSRGWDIIDFDSSLFYPQDSGVLTLRSARGDYWVRPYDTPYIKNVVYRELPNGCFEVTTKFTFHNNFEGYQQCGVILLDKYKNRRTNIRMTYSQTGLNNENPRIFDIIELNYGESTQHGLLPIVKKNDTINYNFYFKILKHNNEIRFYVHMFDESVAFFQLTSVNIKFEPQYIALVSFNGYRMSTDGPLNTASSIPARFDWVNVEECK